MVGKITPRQTGAVATLGRLGQPVVTTPSGGEITVVTRPSEPGFSPLDLLYSALAGCLVLSLRIAASEAGLIDAITSFNVTVTGTKAASDPSRVERFHVTIMIEGDIEEPVRRMLAERAEHICTISNTLRHPPTVEFVQFPRPNI